MFIYYFLVVVFMYDYKKLKVWRRAFDLIGVIDGITARFPRREDFELGKQIRNATESISFNIAEGNSRDEKGYIYFLKIALGSVNEVEVQVLTCDRLGYLKDSEKDGLLKESHEIGKMINGVIGFLRKKMDKKSNNMV